MLDLKDVEIVSRQVNSLGGETVFFNTDKWQGASVHLQEDEKLDGPYEKALRPLIPKDMKVTTAKQLERIASKAAQEAQDKRDEKADARIEAVNKALDGVSGGSISDVSEIADAEAFILTERANRHRAKIAKK